MKRRVALLGLLIALAAALAACGGDDASSPSETSEPTGGSVNFNPRPGNSELVIGPNRVAIAVADDELEPLLGDPGNSVRVKFGDAPIEDATFVEAIPNTTGFWIVRHTFEEAGEVPAVITITRGEDTQDVSVRVNVLATGTTPMIGSPAPATENPTISNQPNRKQLTTDSEPNDAFYQMTVTEALAAGKAFVVAFATPAFCQSALCGPVLDNVKAVQPEFADAVNFIHIEPYVLDPEGGLADGRLIAAPSTNDWALQAEPWIFVVGADGIIKDRFEGSASPQELRESIEAALG